MSLRDRLLAIRAEIDEAIDDLPAEKRPAKPRRRTVRTLAKPTSKPNDLQRARAKRFLREGGFDR